MPILIWDKAGERVYETGLDKGVLYLPDGSAVPWNGLTSVIESFDKETSPVYYDGMKINELIILGDFSASMKAITYPDEFVEMEGLVSMRPGFLASDQVPKTFGLCYRTRVGNDLEGEDYGYKIHILYNVTAIPKDKTYASTQLDPSVTEFEWDITAVPEEAPGLRPTAHFIINSVDIDPLLLEELESMLYGDAFVSASLIPMADLVTFINDWFLIKIIDNGDGTWSAVSLRAGYITNITPDLFQLIHANVMYLNDFTFNISDTFSLSDIPTIQIDDNSDGTWSATSDQAGIINILSSDTFEIINANTFYLNAYTYQISNTDV